MTAFDLFSLGKLGFNVARDGLNLLRRGCFVAGTPVQVLASREPVSEQSEDKANVVSQPIEEVKAGQQVATRNPQTGKTEFRRVVKTTVRTVTELVKVSLAKKSGQVEETLTTTSEHPFFVQGKGFVPAGRLAVGNAIVTRAGPDLVVHSVQHEEHPEGIRVYNLEVEGDHTYFVGKVNGGAWVHNVCKVPLPQNWRGWRDALKRFRNWSNETKDWVANSEDHARQFAEEGGLKDAGGYGDFEDGTYQTHPAEPESGQPEPYNNMPHLKYYRGKGQRGHIWFPSE